MAEKKKSGQEHKDLIQKLGFLNADLDIVNPYDRKDLVYNKQYRIKNYCLEEVKKFTSSTTFTLTSRVSRNSSYVILYQKNSI